jgi:hypothetical protein
MGGYNFLFIIAQKRKGVIKSIYQFGYFFVVSADNGVLFETDTDKYNCANKQTDKRAKTQLKFGFQRLIIYLYKT